MRIYRAVGESEIISLRLDAGDTLEEMAAQAPITMYELAEKIEDIITGAGGAYEDAKAVEEYKRGLVIQLNAWALEEREKDTAAWLKPAPLLQRVAEKIERGEL